MPLLAGKDQPVAMRGSHEQEHRQRQPGVGARGNESLAWKFRRRRGPALQSADDSLVGRPDDAPDVKQHQDAIRAANSDRNRFVARIILPADSHHGWEKLEQTKSDYANENKEHDRKNSPIFDQGRNLLD